MGKDDDARVVSWQVEFDGDDPADVDPAEFPPERTVACDPVPEAIEAETTTPRPENTGRHRVTSQQFASAVDLADQDGYRRGLEHGDAAGYARGLVDGKAEVKAEDWEDGVECALRGVRLWMATNGIVNVDAMTTAARPFIKRGG